MEGSATNSQPKMRKDMSISGVPVRGDVESFHGGHYNVMAERQLEKEMIRREILAEEAARRKELEAEVRRELKEERERELLRELELLQRDRAYEAFRRDCYGEVERRMLERRGVLPGQERVYDFPRLEEGKGRGYERGELQVRISSGVFKAGQEKQIISLERRIGGNEKEDLPFQRASQPLKTEVKSPLDVFKEKKIIPLAKPNVNHSGKKRKEMTSPVEGSSDVTKKVTKEWSCALCQITATSERGLEDHFKGKKHQSKLARPKAKAGMIGLSPEKINIPPNLSQVGERNVKPEKSQEISNKHETVVENNKTAIVMEKEKRRGSDKKMPGKKKMYLKFYCEICDVGAFCEQVIDKHKKGKKHLSRLCRLGAKDEALVGPQMGAKDEATVGPQMDAKDEATISPQMGTKDESMAGPPSDI